MDSGNHRDFAGPIGIRPRKQPLLRVLEFDSAGRGEHVLYRRGEFTGGRQ